MSKFISTCCVCGKIMGVTTTNDGKDVERASHGYCGKDCAEQTPVQIMRWDKDIGSRMMDAANMTGSGRIFYRMQALDNVVTINKKDRRVESLFWNECMYELAEFTPFSNKEHGNRLLVDAVKEGCIVVL